MDILVNIALIMVLLLVLSAVIPLILVCTIWILGVIVTPTQELGDWWRRRQKDRQESENQNT